MLKYAKMEDSILHTVSVGLGTNHTFYESLGMTPMKVAQSDVDGQWYLADFVPRKSEKEKRRGEAEARMAEVLHYLDSSDWYAVRFAETGVPIPDEVREKRQAAREEIDALRLELAEMDEEPQTEAEAPTE